MKAQSAVDRMDLERERLISLLHRMPSVQTTCQLPTSLIGLCRSPDVYRVVTVMVKIYPAPALASCSRSCTIYRTDKKAFASGHVISIWLNVMSPWLSRTGRWAIAHEGRSVILAVGNDQLQHQSLHPKSERFRHEIRKCSAAHLGEYLVQVIASLYPIHSTGDAAHDKDFAFNILIDLAKVVLKVIVKVESGGKNGGAER